MPSSTRKENRFERAPVQHTMKRKNGRGVTAGKMEGGERRTETIEGGSAQSRRLPPTLEREQRTNWRRSLGVRPCPLGPLLLAAKKGFGRFESRDPQC